MERNDLGERFGYVMAVLRSSYRIDVDADGRVKTYHVPKQYSTRPLYEGERVRCTVVQEGNIPFPCVEPVQEESLVHKTKRFLKLA